MFGLDVFALLGIYVVVAFFLTLAAVLLVINTHPRPASPQVIQLLIFPVFIALCLMMVGRLPSWLWVMVSLGVAAILVQVITVVVLWRRYSRPPRQNAGGEKQ
ncbi:hypothetical protein [Schleiferilactobacillus perolens]|uniref:Uncharacterized protein n=1 Tax=Schleiferilactobacillus perolens DSM 12744 TaxID=1423792 RepID=A0A0R1N5D6_9LACO|nr:hypothetical protein [Schleiferilactobacillus perolens]KRL11368.1 hypothetical protein FD09_GL000738 [Schleiferilactobacillus perolens DSM 12744]